MKVLVINCGSSSLKFQLIDMSNENVLAKGNVERIGSCGSFMKYQRAGEDKQVFERELNDHSQALQLVTDTLLDENKGVIKNINEISAVGHRVVHGGEYFSESVIIDEKVIKAIEDCIDLAPLHNPPNLIGIEACRKLMPNVPMVAVFDTAFHQTMPKHAYMYALPYEMYEKYRIRKYGFHGTSHKYVFHRAVELTGMNPDNVRAITCHLGNGASLCAIKDGKSIDTSMGFTPLAGLEMGTRSGNLDPAIITYIMEKENLNIKEIQDLLNKKSGVLGLSGISNDMRDVEAAASDGNERAQLAIDVFTYRVKMFLSMYAGILGGLDLLIFTAGIGEMDKLVRAEVTRNLEFMGIEIDLDKNEVLGKEIEISKTSSKVKVLVIPTNEELMIAKDTVSLVNTK